MQTSRQQTHQLTKHLQKKRLLKKHLLNRRHRIGARRGSRYTRIKKKPGCDGCDAGLFYRKNSVNMNAHADSVPSEISVVDATPSADSLAFLS